MIKKFVKKKKLSNAVGSGELADHSPKLLTVSKNLNPFNISCKRCTGVQIWFVTIISVITFTVHNMHCFREMI